MPQELYSLFLSVVWTLESSRNGRGWLRAASSTLIYHLRCCPLQTADTRSKADMDHKAHGGGGGTSPARGRRSGTENFHVNTEPQVNLLPVCDSNGLLLPIAAGSSMGPGTLTYTAHSPISPMPVSPLPLSPALSSIAIPFSASPSLSFPPSALNSPILSGSGASVQSRPASLQSYSFRRASSRRSSTPDTSAAAWSPIHQKRFEMYIGRLTAATGFALSWVDNPVFIEFMEEFLPAAKLPSRKVLTRRSIPAAVAEYQAEAKVEARGCEGTIQADGCTGTNYHHLIAFMVTVDEKVSQNFQCT
jgi:hypothetical protein